MKKFSSNSANSRKKSDTTNNDDYDDDYDDIATFQLDSKEINFSYSQFVKYSKHIRTEYAYSDIINRLPQEIHQFQEEFQCPSENIFIFFQLLEQNFNLNKNFELTYEQCINLLKISKFFDVKKLSNLITRYINDHNIDVDFTIQTIQYNINLQKETSNFKFEINSEMENLLSVKIDDCFSNKKFAELPIPIIYRIIKQSPPQLVTSDKIFNFIKGKSISKFAVLFSLIELKDLSNENLDELCVMYSNSDESNKKYYSFMQCNLDMINEMNKNKKKLEGQLKSIEAVKEKQQKQIDEFEIKTKQMQNQLIQLEKNRKEIEDEKNLIQSKLIESEKNKDKVESENNKLHKKVIDLEKNRKEIEDEKSLIQRKFKELEQIKNDLQKQLDKELNKINGQINTKVKKGLIISASINLKSNSDSIDLAESRYIISKSGAKNLGKEAYKNGEKITSLQMNTNEFICKSGTYYVRCIIFNKNGKSTEIVSEPVTTRGINVSFDYKGKASKISLLEGKYKLEVWGAKGGDRGGKGKSEKGVGGLGGYSRGTLTLKEPETVYIYVGGEGRPSNTEDGSTTSGGFPDGGGTKTGHFSSEYTSSPGTGGGSTSIRLKSDSQYSRVIVAGGGGGAGGDYYTKDDGGFGGGLSGGNCSYGSSLKNQGSGTQTGSTRGIGVGSNGDAGRFGEGAAGKYGGDSGGGGGGGWYGGGGGGCGGKPFLNRCSSGGGGSGWTFTESNFSLWQSGDKSNASKFLLKSSHYLTEAITVGGDEEFPRTDGAGNEVGHSGNGYAKITPE